MSTRMRYEIVLVEGVPQLQAFTLYRDSRDPNLTPEQAVAAFIATRERQIAQARALLAGLAPTGAECPATGPPIDIDTLLADVERLDREHSKHWTAKLCCGGAVGGTAMEWGRVGNEHDQEVAHTDDPEISILIARFRGAAPALAAEVRRLRALVRQGTS